MGKYRVGLARYAQSPLNEFAALGSDIAALTLDDEGQHLVSVPSSSFFLFLILLQVPRENLLTALERVLVGVSNKVGVDINCAVADSYYHHLGTAEGTRSGEGNRSHGECQCQSLTSGEIESQ